MEVSVFDVIGGALTLNREAFAALVQSSHPVRTSVFTLLLVGASWIIGHCSVLFLNRVPPERFIKTTAGLILSFVLGALIWVASTWLIASILPGNRQVPLWVVLPMTAFAYAPLALGVLIIIPYFGSGIETLLNTWSLLTLVLAVSVAFEVGVVQALACAGLGWALTKLLPRLAGGRLNPVFDNAWNRVSSTRARAQGEAAAAEAVARMRSP